MLRIEAQIAKVREQGPDFRTEQRLRRLETELRELRRQVAAMGWRDEEAGGLAGYGYVLGHVRCAASKIGAVQSSSSSQASMPLSMLPSASMNAAERGPTISTMSSGPLIDSSAKSFS
jgi:hypothetical protein